MKKFRVPRKIKKKITKDMWFYPMDEKTKSYTMIFPAESQENYNIWKKGELNSLRDEVKFLSKKDKELTVKIVRL